MISWIINQEAESGTTAIPADESSVKTNVILLLAMRNFMHLTRPISAAAQRQAGLTAASTTTPPRYGSGAGDTPPQPPHSLGLAGTKVPTNVSKEKFGMPFIRGMFPFLLIYVPFAFRKLNTFCASGIV
jgi:hypothetical protein